MLDKFKFKICYAKEGKEISVNDHNNDDFSLDFSYKNNRFKLAFIPKGKLEMKKISLIYDYNFSANAKVFVNGYQSWTYSREYTREEKQIGLKSIAKYPPIKNIAYISGDYHFVQYPNNSGIFHSFTYGYVKNADKIDLIGSLSEREGFTIIRYDYNAGTIEIEKEVEGLTIDSKIDFFDLFFTSDDYDNAFDNYFNTMQIPAPRLSHLAGYTSWYNYFGKIDEKIILRDLDGLTRVGDSADIFQIDDGYQSAVGDWLTLKTDKFPRGMKFLADKIHEKGYLAGLWLAPFSCQKNSTIAKEHPEWLVKGKNGKPVYSVFAWGGAYTIDFYLPEVRDYLKKVFYEILKVWGFDMVKLDFLYSCCMYPRHNKTRGKIMCEAMDFLRECVGDKYILGCGVPLGPSFGKVDFCRIGSDVHIAFKDPFYVKLLNQEIISTKTALTNAVFRRHLNNRAFVNDPDVFLLRDKKTELEGAKDTPLAFSLEQKKLLAHVNSLFGDILFVSDNIGAYNEEKMSILLKAYERKDYKILSADIKENNIFSINYQTEEAKYNLTFDVEKGWFKETKI